MARPKVNFTFEADQEAKDVHTALKIQLEMLKQRTTLALTSMRMGRNRELQEQISAIRQLSIRIHNLGYVTNPSDDQRLLTSIRECRYTSESTSNLYKDEQLIDIQGMYDIKKLSRRFLW
jgi:hypothetical protein